MKKVYTYYFVRKVKTDSYLRVNRSRYGISLSLSGLNVAEKYDSFKDAESQILAYCKEKKTMNASMFEITKMEISYEDIQVTSCLPNTKTFSSYSWGITFKDALTIKEDEVREMLIKTYKLNPKSFTYQTEVTREPLYQYVPEGPMIDSVYITVKDIIWEV